MQLRPPEDLAQSARKHSADYVEFTELTPVNRAFAGKRIMPDGTIEAAPKARWWYQRVVRVPTMIPLLHAYLAHARTRNIILIRGTPANIKRQQTLKQIAYVFRGQDRGDHGFIDEPTRWFSLDIDGIVIPGIDWRADVSAAVRIVLQRLGEPYAATSCVYLLTTKCGLDLIEKPPPDGKGKPIKQWTGQLGDRLYLRLFFITDKALDQGEAKALTTLAEASGIKLDTSICGIVQPNYIRRPQWEGHPGRDVLGAIPTIGIIKSTSDTLAVPADLRKRARWQRAQGLDSSFIVHSHVDAIGAVRGIGSDGQVRKHMATAIKFLMNDNPKPEEVSDDAHASAIVQRLTALIEQHRGGIELNLAVHARSLADVYYYLPGNMFDVAGWYLARPGSLRWRRTINVLEEFNINPQQAELDAVLDKVKASIEAAAAEPGAPAVLVVAPCGTWKSTLLRQIAAAYVRANSGKRAVILTSRHSLNAEALEKLKHDHPGIKAAIWRGRYADENSVIDLPQCHRQEEAMALESRVLDPDHLCERGRGQEKVKCAFFERCRYQQQKDEVKKAEIILGAHELMTHEMPKEFGDVGLLLIDEDCSDALIFGIDPTTPFTLPLDALKEKPVVQFDKVSVLMSARGALYEAFDALAVPTDQHQGIPILPEHLVKFADQHIPGREPDDEEDSDNVFDPGIATTIMAEYPAREMIKLEWQGRVPCHIDPAMGKNEVLAAVTAATGNELINKRVALWKLIAAGGGGRVQVHRGGDGGRVIRMVGLNRLAKGWRDLKTILCDATGDIELLKPTWPHLREERALDGWTQLRSPHTRIFQCVDDDVSKKKVAVEGKAEHRPAKERRARRLWATILSIACGYGGRAVGVVVYKSTRDWIEKHCHVPDWITLLHHGAHTGTNALQEVAALIVAGRPLAQAEMVTRMTEGRFGEYIAARKYTMRKKAGKIPTVDGGGIEVDMWAHPHERCERQRRLITEAAVIQAIGRARAALRGPNDPLDIHLLTDVALPELGRVEPVLWEDIAAGLDEAMLAHSGVWVERPSDAAAVFAPGLKAKALERSRERRDEAWLMELVGKQATAPFRRFTYQRRGAGRRRGRGLSLLDPAATREFLERRLQDWAWIEIE